MYLAGIAWLEACAWLEVCLLTMSVWLPLVGKAKVTINGWVASGGLNMSVGKAIQSNGAQESSNSGVIRVVIGNTWG